MAGVDVGGGAGSKRAVNSDINMIPFIDLLMVTIAFLLITAVWVSFSRLNANAEIPGPPNPGPVVPGKVEKVLHVHAVEGAFSLVWKQGATVVSESRVPRPEQQGDLVKYSDLAQKVAEEWKVQSGHQDPSDKATDLAVLHMDNRMPFRDVVGMIDAVYETQRDFRTSAELRRLPVFNVTMSAR